MSSSFPVMGLQRTIGALPSAPLHWLRKTTLLIGNDCLSVLLTQEAHSWSSIPLYKATVQIVGISNKLQQVPVLFCLGSLRNNQHFLHRASLPVHLLILRLLRKVCQDFFLPKWELILYFHSSYQNSQPCK